MRYMILEYYLDTEAVITVVEIEFKNKERIVDKIVHANSNIQTVQDIYNGISNYCQNLESKKVIKLTTEEIAKELLLKEFVEV